MDSSRRPADERLETVRVLLLLQGSILAAATIEALIWGMAFGAAGSPAGLCAAAAAVALVGRARLRPDRRWTRRLVYTVEGITLATLAVDATLALAITGALPPPVALLTRLVLPIAVIALLRGSARATAAPIPSGAVAPVEVAS